MILPTFRYTKMFYDLNGAKNVNVKGVKKVTEIKF